MISPRRSSWCRFAVCAVLALVGVAAFILPLSRVNSNEDGLVALDLGSVGAIVDETARTTPFTLVEIVNETVFVGRVHGRGLRAHGHHHSSSFSSRRRCKQSSC